MAVMTAIHTAPHGPAACLCQACSVECSAAGGDLPRPPTLLVHGVL